MNKLSIENKIESLNKVAEFIEQFGDSNGLESKSVFELNLILDELITNIISYAFPDNDNHTIDIYIEKIKDEVNIQLIDDGKGFNPLEQKEIQSDLPLEKREIGGLGIHIVKQKADALSYKRDDKKNHLFITKKLKENGD